MRGDKVIFAPSVSTRLKAQSLQAEGNMTKKQDRLIYDPLYRLKPAVAPAQVLKKRKRGVWLAVVRILRVGSTRRERAAATRTSGRL
jgi:hypothetical protein